MNIRPSKIASTIASILACSLLAACGGGGGGMVRSGPAPASPPPAAPPPPPPPAAPATLCPMPLTSDCVVMTRGVMLDGRESAHGLVVRTGSESLGLVGASYRFDKGTRIETGQLNVGSGSTGSVSYYNPGTVLISDTTVETAGTLSIAGRVVGDVNNRGKTILFGSIDGSLVNHGDTLLYYGGVYGDPPPQVLGDFTQSSAGTLKVQLAPGGASPTAYLIVAGRATLAGTLELREYYDAWGPYPLPAAGAQHILHADGGVFGSFDRWTSPGLFVEGVLRYGANDVWFDLTRISVQAAMAGQGFGGITLASAGNLDRALASADLFSSLPSSTLNATQTRFLQSAGKLLWLDDAGQAARSLDSIAGSLHVDAMHALAQDDALARGIGARTLALHPGMQVGAWSQVQGGNTLAGFDQWLAPRWLVGAIAAQARDARRDTFGGHAQHDAPQAAAYLRWFGNDGWYAGGSAGYAQQALNLDRRIDLANGGTWNAHAQRRLGFASFDAEAGRRFDFDGLTLAPYVWLGADAMRSEGALEQGQSGFELALQANTQASLDAGLGLRVGKQWRFGGSGWLAIDADARYRQRLAQAGDPLRAAFIGVPDTWFDVPGNEARSGTWLDLGLRGGFGRGWGWSLGHAGSLAGDTQDRRWQVGLRRTF